VAFTPSGHLLVQTREPARLEFVTSRSRVLLSYESRLDTGHAVFHANAGSGLTCATCHPEGGEDGRVWEFQKIGPRRTQSLRGGVLATAPFHWNGDLKDVSRLMKEVFESRMGGPELTTGHHQALGRWMDAIPGLPPGPARDEGAVDRGRALFHDQAVGCAGCHGGALTTDNRTVDVGTGKALQVPSLRGVGFRAPFMHDGCAPTLADRFRSPACGGGDKHGVTSRLSEGQIADLVSYLESL
jgi:mono/diheme cytochrome c family protein